MACYELVESGLKAVRPDATLYDAISAAGVNPDGLSDDISTFARLGDARRELERKAERSVRMLDNGSSGNGPEIDDQTYDRIRNQAPRPVYSRLRRARRLDRRYRDGEMGEKAFASDDLLHAESNRDLVGDLERSARASSVQNAVRQQQGQLDRAVASGRTSSERKMLLNQAIRTASKQLDAAIEEVDVAVYEPPREVRQGLLVQLGDF